MNEYIGECLPKTNEEKLMFLLGRVQAFAAYVNSIEYSIDREVAAKMLGFEIIENGAGCCNYKGDEK